MARTAAQALIDQLALHGVEHLRCAPDGRMQKVRR